MYYFREFSGDGPEHRDYDQTIRDRANESLEELRDSLKTPPAGSSSVRTPSGGNNKQQLRQSVHPRVLTWQDGSVGAGDKHSRAADQLRNLLEANSYGQIEIPPVVTSGGGLTNAGGGGGHIGPLPSPEEALTLLKNQAVYTSHLEAESRYIKEEMVVLRLKLSETLEENRSLHNELKTTVVHEILKDGGDVVNLMGSFDQNFSEPFTNVMSRHDFKRWQVELERLSKLHTARNERMEAQLESSKAEVDRLEQVVEDLKSQLRADDWVPTRENGQMGGTFLSETERNITHRTIDKLTKERDDLMDHVTTLQSQLQQMSYREEEAYQQMKKGIELVEQAQLEQTEALVQKEQVSEELARTRQRFDAHIQESQNLVKVERETVRRESQQLIDDLNAKLQELGEHYTLVQAKYEKEVRAKATLATELTELKGQLRTCDKEGTVTAESYRTETTNASLQRNSALYETNRLRSELEKVKHDRDQELSRCKIENDDMRQRLNKAERELVNTKEECIHMTGTVQALEREVHLAKMARDTIERSRAEDLKVIRKRAQDREEELRLKLEESDDRHNQSSHEMDTMLLKQNKLILKLREECKKQALHLEKTIKKYRSENGKLSLSNSEMQKRMERMTQRVTELEAQADQHGRVHDKMRERLKSLDEQAQNQALQLVEGLTKYSQASRDRHLLAREVEFLRTQLHRAIQTSPEVLRLNSSSKVLVDDILNSMTKEERDGTAALLPELQILQPELPEKITMEDLGPE